MTTRKEFNAQERLKDFDPAEEREFRPALNGLSVGSTVKFYEPETPIIRTWAKKQVDCIETDSGIVCIPEWVASCVQENDLIYKNADKGDQFICVLPKRADKDKIVCLKDYVTDANPSFPPILVKGMYPVALKRADLITSGHPNVLATYRKEFGVELKDLDLEWVPALRELTDGKTGKKFIRKSLTAVFELV